MANLPKQSNAAANAAADAACALANSGRIRIYTGSQPANADAAIGAVTLLAELTNNATAFGAAVAGVATANAVTSDSSADNTGTAAWFRQWKSDGTSPLWDGTVGTASCDLNINTTAIVSGAAVAITAYTYSISKG